MASTLRIILLVHVLYWFNYSVQAQRWDLEAQAPGGNFFPSSVASVENNDFVAIGQGWQGYTDSEQGRLFRFRNGSVLWSKRIVDPSLLTGNTQFTSMLIALNGDIIIAGSYQKAGTAGFVARFDIDGTLLWSAAARIASEIIQFNTISEAPDGSLYTVGRAGIQNSMKPCIAKFSASGILLWMREFEQTGVMNMLESKMQSDTLLVIGRPYSATASGIPLFRIAPDGTLLTQRVFSLGNYVARGDIIPDGSGGYIIPFEQLNGQLGVMCIGANLEPVGQAVLLSSQYALRLTAGAIFNNITNECTLLGCAVVSGNYLSIALCFSLNTNSLVWERTLSGRGYFFSTCLAAEPNTMLASRVSGEPNSNGNLAGSILRMDLSTGENKVGPSCDISMPLLPTFSQAPISFVDLFPPMLAVVPGITQGFSAAELPITITTCTPLPLPVVWLDWKAESAPDGIQLTWSTASETNNDRYIIERSIDTERWENIGEVQTTGNTVMHTNYVWKDEFPNVGTNYYRLRQLDKDGSFNLTSVQAVQWSGSEQGPLFYPNPAAPEQVVRSREMVVVMDLLGKQVQGPTLQFQAPQQPGLYLVRGKTRVEQLVVH